MMYREDDAGEWNDLACSKVTGFICQSNLGKLTISNKVKIFKYKQM